MFLDHSSDIFICTMSLMLEEGEGSNQEVEENQEKEFFKFFKNLWFSYLKQELAYLERMKPLQAQIKDNLTRVLKFLVQSKRIFGADLDVEGSLKVKVWNKSWAAIDPFYPDLKANVLKSK